MFKLKAQNTFTWTVVAKVPEDNKHKKVTFDAEFNVLSQEKISELMDNDLEQGTVRVLEKALLRYEMDVVDDKDEPVTDLDERRKMILTYPYFVKALSDAYAAGVSGFRAKN